MSSFHYNNLLPELKGEVRSHMTLMSKLRLSMTCREEHALYPTSPISKWPRTILEEYRNLTNQWQVLLHKRSYLAEGIHRWKETMMEAAEQILPWLGIPTHFEPRSFAWRPLRDTTPRVDLHYDYPYGLYAHVRDKSWTTIFSGYVKPEDPRLIQWIKDVS